jgi:1-acyl-sn-glycerol-3-phosphate acyltransferase
MNKKSGKRQAKRPGLIRYALLGGLISLYARLFKHQKVISALPKGLKPPYIVIGNHTTFYDFVYTIRCLYPERINFVVARKYFHFTGLGPVMKLGRAIPKSLFQSDTGTIVAMLQILKQGGVVGMFPEGQISIGGITNDYNEAIAKLIKKAGVPVVRVLTGGAYFCDPPWGKNPRKGPIESRVDLVLTKEQTEVLSVGTILEKLRQGTFIDNYRWQEATGSLYQGKDLTQGLENILYRCPCCDKAYTVETRGDAVFCTSCGMEALYGTDGHLHWKADSSFRHIGDWLAWQIQKERDDIASADGYAEVEPVTLAMLKTKGMGVEPVGSGTFSADREAFCYTGTLRGQPVCLTFPVNGIRSLPFDAGRNFQIYHKDLLYEFRPINPKWVMKIANICEALHTLPEREATSDLLPRRLRVNL